MTTEEATVASTENGTAAASEAAAEKQSLKSDTNPEDPSGDGVGFDRRHFCS